MNYSLLKQLTGSFFEALLDGIRPENNVSPILIRIRIMAAGSGRIAFKLANPVKAFNIKLIGIHSKYVTSTPSKPEEKPIIIVSALNMLDTLFLDAPIALNIPISLVLS